MPSITPDVGTVGDVKYSILPPEKFKKLNGDAWRLMNGENIEGTRLAELAKIKQLPDASNKFIRCLDSKDGRKVGSSQDDTTRMPRTKPFTGVTSDAGEHKHKLGYKGHCLKNSNSRDDVNLETTGWFGEKYTHNAGKHKHSVKISGGDPETRPKNIALYTYIKVN